MCHPELVEGRHECAGKSVAVPLLRGVRGVSPAAEWRSPFGGQGAKKKTAPLGTACQSENN